MGPGIGPASDSEAVRVTSKKRRISSSGTSPLHPLPRTSGSSSGKYDTAAVSVDRVPHRPR